MSHNYTLAFLFLISLTWLTACKEDTIDFVQLGSISGTVYQANTGEPLEGVEMTTVPATSVIITDSAGFFRFLDVPANNYRLRARLEDYQVESVSISVVGTGESVSSIFLVTEDGILQSAISPVPADESSNVGTNVQLSWSNPNDSIFNVRYDVEVFESSSGEIFQKFENLEDTLVALQNLKFNTQYFWQVGIKINQSDDVEYSKVWKFTTGEVPDNPILMTIQDANGYMQVYSSDEEGGNLTQLTYSEQDKYGPVYNDNRSHIAFLGKNGLDNHIYVMENDGGDIQQVTSVPVASYHQEGRGFTWFGNTRFIYCHYDKLYRIQQDGNSLIAIATAPVDRHFRSCDWGQATEQIIVETIGVRIYDGEIYVMDDDGSNMTELIPNSAGIIENPSFTVDGLSFMYTADLSGNESLNGRQLDSHIILSPLADPTNSTDLSVDKDNGTNDLFPKLSPNGANIIFLNRDNNQTGMGTIVKMAIDDPSSRTEVIEEATYPSWQ